jgi:hypothetical protein
MRGVIEMANFLKQFRTFASLAGGSLAVTALLLTTSPVMAQVKPRIMPAPLPAYVIPRALNGQQLLHIYRGKLEPLREEILARKAQEGGMLSEQSRAEFQERLDRINADFRRFVQKQDVRGANGAGFQEG